MAPSLQTVRFSPLLDILTEEQTRTQSFETLCNKFHYVFKKEEKFKVANSLFLLLQHEDLLPLQTQKLCAVVLLYDLYRRDLIVSTPYLPLFIHIINGADAASDKCSDAKDRTAAWVKSSVLPNRTADLSVNGGVRKYASNVKLPKFSIEERNFLSQLVKPGSNAKELLKTTAQRVITSGAKYTRSDISDLEKAVEQRQKDLDVWNKWGDCETSLIVNDPESEKAAATEQGSYDVEEMKKVFEELCNIGIQSSYVPNFLRLAPPLFPTEDEVCWFDLTDPWEHKIIYDESMVDGSEIPAAVLQAEHLLSMALKCALHPSQQDDLLNRLNDDPTLLNQIGMTPAKFPDLVENNPKIAFEVLWKLLNSPEITDYFSMIVNSKASLHSMEVVNNLTTKADLPKEFISLYVGNCITTCQTIEDRYLQNRLVRLACIFFQTLIRNKIVDVMDVYSELQQFCISFVRIKEAAALFKLLKNAQGIQETGGETPASETATAAGDKATADRNDNGGDDDGEDDDDSKKKEVAKK